MKHIKQFECFRMFMKFQQWWLVCFATCHPCSPCTMLVHQPKKSWIHGESANFRSSTLGPVQIAQRFNFSLLSKSCQHGWCRIQWSLAAVVKSVCSQVTCDLRLLVTNSNGLNSDEIWFVALSWKYWPSKVSFSYWQVTLSDRKPRPLWKARPLWMHFLLEWSRWVLVSRS